LRYRQHQADDDCECGSCPSEHDRALRP
jgi:hypothetical protein